MTTLPPDFQLQRLANAYQLSRAVQVAARLDLGRLLAAGPRGAGELARSTGTDEGVLTRLLRLLAQLQVVEELPGPAFGPTPLSERLHLVDNIAQGEEAWAAWGALPEALRTGEETFSRVHGRSFYDHAAAHPRQAANWRETGSTHAAAFAPAVAAGLALEGRERVVDVGGGQGVLLAEVLRRHPACRGVLYDLPEALTGAGELLAEAGVAARCEVVPGDFRQSPREVPGEFSKHLPAGGDVYLLCRVLFNWGDDEARRLLERCRQALTGTGRLLVVETLMPEVGDPTRLGLAAADLHHFLLWGSGYRTRAEFAALLASAGLALAEVRRAEDGRWHILEARADA